MIKPGGHGDEKQHIAVFASGAGSNAQKIIDHFASPPTTLQNGQGEKGAKVALIVCNKPGAGVLKIAEKENIPTLIIERKKFYEDAYLEELNNYSIDLIVLAGFLWKVPDLLIRSYPHKIVNIHPALLPKYGGKGMYGSKVHEAVINSKDKQSGITIHYVDEIYDHGEIIFQATCNVDEKDTVETLGGKVHALEHEHYPAIIESIISPA